MDIPHIAKPTREEFAHATQGGTQPAVITGELEDWPAWRSWSLDYFSHTFGERKFKVSVSEDGIFYADLVHGFERVPRMYLTFSEFSDLIREKDARRYYINQCPIHRGLNSIEKDIVRPAFTGAKKYSGINCWIGAAGNVSPAHFDKDDNILSQIRGEKIVTLFSPRDDEFLYPYPIESKVSHMSLVDVESPDLDRFPEFARSSPMKTTLSAGDMIYIPRYWWHHIRTVRDSISVNFWWTDT